MVDSKLHINISKLKLRFLYLTRDTINLIANYSIMRYTIAQVLWTCMIQMNVIY